MNIEEFRSYCLSKPATTEHIPFGPSALVFKVMNKMFALADLDAFQTVSLKCDPEQATMLREQYAQVRAGYHMNKKHWNTIDMDGSISDAVVYQWIDASYQLVVAGLPKKAREQMKAGE
jgi:predicted DNA-binding protein (MmcQ/YjbR family)